MPAAAAMAAGAWTGLHRLEAGARRSGIAAGGTRSAARLNVAEADTLPVEAWTDRFRELETKGDWASLAADLETIRQREPDLYRRYQLGYLHARAKVACGDLAGGRAALE
ncbi:MAG: hypothetical protein DMF78_12130, partial [Acidobacteria bacterium]